MSPARRKTRRNSPCGAGIAAVMPASLEPMLPTAIKLPFSDPQWVFEPKWDGYRALCFLKDGKVRFISRNRAT